MLAPRPPFNDPAPNSNSGGYHHGQKHVRPVPRAPIYSSHTTHIQNQSVHRYAHPHASLPANHSYAHNQHRPSYPPYAATTYSRDHRRHHPMMHFDEGFQPPVGQPMQDANRLQF